MQEAGEESTIKLHPRPSCWVACPSNVHPVSMREVVVYFGFQYELISMLGSYEFSRSAVDYFDVLSGSLFVIPDESVSLFKSIVYVLIRVQEVLSEY